MRIPTTARLGFGVILTGLLVFGGIKYWVETRTVLPVLMRVSLAGGHIKAEDFKINYRGSYSIGIGVWYPPYPSPACKLNSVRWAWRLSSIDGRIVGQSQGGGDERGRDILSWLRIGEFDGKPGRYSLDLDVLSDSSCLNGNRPQLEVGTSSQKLEELYEVSLWVVWMCAVMGTILLAAGANRGFGRPATWKSEFKIFAASGIECHPVRPWSVRRDVLSRVTVGMSAIVVGIALFGGARYWLSTQSDYAFPPYEYVCLILQFFSVSLIAAGLVSLRHQGTGRFDQTRDSVRLAPFLGEQKLSWGVTGLRHCNVRPSSVAVPNPATDFPRMALVLVPFLLTMLAIFMIGNGPWWGPHGLPVRLVRQFGPVVQRDPWVEALVVRVANGGHLYVNSKEVKWAELPGAVKQALGQRAERWVYFEGDHDIRFSQAARAIDIIEAEGGKVVLVTPGTRAEAQ
jgi:biopolymer transport protein ExbD